jgi:hypothetical protein
VSAWRGALKLVFEDRQSVTKVAYTVASERIMAEFPLGQDKQLPGEPEEVSRLIKDF